ncbi:hypothetical protein HK097_011279 [Rhizophlyctis rosea]|uniref:FAD-binding FR-type domain-containing protein n=1 Tax=Rhizophlyctis rosea TaxID=64517 RepID=A0AAD5WZC0_9FUNG|nr:hypothetical protein HK097_011279 [Rhizophlyctis rosea]
MAVTFQTVLFWIFWLTLHIGLFIFGFIKQKDDSELWLLNTIQYSVWTSRGAGLTLALDAAVLLLPVCRNVIRIARGILPGRVTRWVDIDRNLFLHKLTAYSLLVGTVVHVNAHYVNFFVVERKLYGVLRLHAEDIHYRSWAGVTGHIMVLCMFFIYTSAKVEVRRRKFEMFWFTHHLFTVFYICLFFHSFGCFVKTSQGVCKGYLSNHYTIPVFSLYILERCIRIYRSSQPTTVTKVIIHPGRTVEIQFEKPSLTYTPGRYVFLNIGEVSRWQWHPFTISSTPEEGFVSVHVRVVGDWTEGLLGLVKKRGKGFRLKVDGPFGAPAEDFDKFENAVLVCAGIGITPAASLLKSVWYRCWRGRELGGKRVWFVWVNREKEAFAWFRSLLHTLEQSVPTANLDIQIYMTGALSTDDIHHISLNDRQHCPFASFQPPDQALLARSNTINSVSSHTPLFRNNSANSVYSTSSDISQAPFLGLQVKSEAGKDPLTSLQSKTHYGRPNFTEIFQRICEQVGTGGESEVGVFYCGPPSGADAVREGVKNVGGKGKGVRIVFRKEKF